jgi:ribose transport system ATP-binding protein
VAENIYLGREAGRYFIIDDASIQKGAQTVLDQLGVQHIDVHQKVSDLPLAQQQLVEIAKAISFKPRILILDEPTAALTPQNAERLFEILKRLKAQGIAIIHITHRLKEIIEHCDKGTILRNGQVVETLSINRETTEDELIELMIGQEVESFYRHEEVVGGGSENARGVGAGEQGSGGAAVQNIAEERDVLLAVEGLSIGERVRETSFQLRPGEILGITGLLGAGQNELVRALFGIQEGVSGGTIYRKGRPVKIDSPRAAIQLGIRPAHETGRKKDFPDLSVKENITILAGPALSGPDSSPAGQPEERRAARS